ncbi:hypothetical protein HP439_14405 [Sphingobacterium shayense]|uniref:tetratricopeptide repeat protein n=1 Tax=Sphingobacterium shayense TaxID=626343 RepID=UPI0015548F53|nr:hypothetical protein [Sphingobacterium shayense]NQD71915.1 hypothetical protein [Sphingobacterium shayense]
MSINISNNLDFKLASSRLFPMLLHRDTSIDFDESDDAFNFAKRGLDAFEQDKFELAFELYSQAIVEFPDVPFFYACRYFTNLMNDEAEGAFYDYGKVASLDRTYCEFIFYVLKSANDQLYGSVVEPNRYSTYEELLTVGKELVLQGDIDPAILVFTEGIAKFGEHSSLLYQRGVLYIRILRYDLAYIDLQKVISLKPDHAYARLFLGTIYEGIKEYELASDYYNQAILLRPDDDVVYQQRAAFYVARKDWRCALDDYDRCIDLNSKEANYYIDRSFIYEEIGNLDAALSDTSEAVLLDPLNSSIYLHRSDIKKQLGDHIGAENDRQISEKLDQDNRGENDELDDIDDIDGWNDDYMNN